MNAQGQPTIVAVVNDEPVADPVVQRATELGFERHARVVLYDVGAKASPLESPLPTEFASDGPDRVRHQQHRRARIHHTETACSGTSDHRVSADPRGDRRSPLLG